MQNSHKNHVPLLITDQLYKKPVEKVEKKIEEFVMDSRLNLVSLKLVVHDWVTKILIPNRVLSIVVAEGIKQSISQSVSRVSKKFSFKNFIFKIL